LRTAAYLILWIVLAGLDLKDLVVGFVSALLASWLSLQLLPPGELTVRPWNAAKLFLRFLVQSVSAGVAVARIALMPSMPLKPGFVEYRSRLPAGNRLYAFMTFAGLLPGTLPVESDEEGSVTIHCLDSDQPVVAQLEEEETRFSSVLSRRAGA
jgi:multicomponent Na+:H+ antiporter subunit E